MLSSYCGILFFTIWRTILSKYCDNIVAENANAGVGVIILPNISKPEMALKFISRSQVFTSLCVLL